MSLYVEVMCDERKEWPRDGLYYGYANRCLSDRGDNPQGYSAAQAKASAKQQGWIVRGNYACCPRCKPDFVPKEVSE